MRAALALVPIVASILALEGTACRTPTAVTVHVLTDVPCDKQRGVIVAAASPGEYETVAAAGRSQRCTPAGDGLNDLGTIVLVPRSSEDDRIGIRAVLGANRDAEVCSAGDGYKGCIVARRLLHYLPHTELTVRVVLRQDCTDVACDALTTCVDETCGTAEIDPGKCKGEGCGEGALPTARPCDTPGEVKCEAGRRLTCSAGVYVGEDCGIACSPTTCVAAEQVLSLAASDQKGTTCALLNDGKVRCWGDNGRGRLGVSGTTAITTPLEVPGLPRIVQIAGMGTSDHVVALDADGAPWCWGGGDSRQCGAPVQTIVAPRRIAGEGGAPITSVAQVAASSNSTCLRFRDGAVRCLGSNSLGQLGRGTVGTGDEIPRPVLANAAWSGVAIDVACASNACCLIDDRAKVACFGNNNAGQVGAGLSETRTGTPSAVALPSAARALRAGDNAFCALLDTDEVACWGSAGYDLYVEPGANQSTPKLLEPLKGKGVRDLAISMPRGHFALTGGTAYGWGTGGLVKGAVAPVPELVGATSASVSFAHACAIVSGAVLCWGVDDSGALGDGTTTPHAAPAPVKWSP